MKLSKIILFSLSLFLGALQADENQDQALHHFMQGEFLMNQGNYALAVLEFQDALTFDPNAPTIHISIADAYRRLGKNNRAENHLNISIELDSTEVEAREMLGQLFVSQKRFIEAEVEFKKLLSEYPDNLDYLYMLADLARLQKNWDKAIDYFIDAYHLNSMGIAGLEQALQIALSTNTFDRAIEICELLINEEPENISFIETLRDLSLFSGEYDKALELVNRLIDLKGSSSELLLHKSALLEELGNSEEALTILYDDVDTTNADFLHRLVSLEMDNKNSETAIKYNSILVDNFKMDPRGFINQALMGLADEKPELAITALSPVVDQFAEDFSIHYLLGTAHYQLKDNGNAENYLSQALNIFPESRNTKHSLAIIYDNDGRWELSDKLYMELIASDSTDAQAYNNYAYSLVERNLDYEFALELAKNAIRLAPESAPYLDTIGWIYFKLNDYEEALVYIKKSLAIDGENEVIRGHLEEVLKVKENKENSTIHQTQHQD